MDKAPQEPIFERLKRKEKGAFTEIYTQYFYTCTKSIINDSGDINDAREVFQEALFSLVLKLQNPNFVIKHSVKGYLSRSCFYIWIKAKQDRRKQMSAGYSIIVNEQHDFIELEEEDTKESLRVKMYQCIKKLGNKCNQLLMLSFFEKKSDADIALIMAYQKGFVKQKRYRCVEQLRKCVNS